jgi:hypothetical protein
MAERRRQGDKRARHRGFADRLAIVMQSVVKRAVAEPHGFGRPGRTRCNEHNGQLVEISGRIVRPRRCFAIQAIGFDISDRMFGFVGNRGDGFDKTATAPHDQTASRSATNAALPP